MTDPVRPELVEQAAKARITARFGPGDWPQMSEAFRHAEINEMRAALATVLPAELERVRQETAVQVREQIAAEPSKFDLAEANASINRLTTQLFEAQQRTAQIAAELDDERNATFGEDEFHAGVRTGLLTAAHIARSSRPVVTEGGQE